MNFLMGVVPRYKPERRDTSDIARGHRAALCHESRAVYIKLRIGIRSMMLVFRGYLLWILSSPPSTHVVV